MDQRSVSYLDLKTKSLVIFLLQNHYLSEKEKNKQIEIIVLSSILIAVMQEQCYIPV